MAVSATQFRGRPATRTRAADHVFETLSRAILSGELAPGTVLATQRELSKQFAVSSLIVRQATHRLEEFGLVRVRQGSTTIVLDPNTAADVRLLQLQLELATPGDWLALAARENQALSTLPLVALAERRATEEELDQLDSLVDALPETPSSEQSLAFVLSYWQAVAQITRNGVIQQQLRWWAGVMQELEQRNGASTLQSLRITRTLFKGLNRALRRKRGAVEYWTRALDGLLAWTEAQPGHALNASKPKPRTPSR
jgi:DNA-binding FadR family transcriptional regulator